MNQKLLPFFMLLALVSCKNSSKQAPPLFSVDVVEAVEQEVPYTLSFVGETAGDRTFTIQPRISGFLVRSYVAAGKPVKKGDLLYEIDPTSFEANLAQAKANLSSSQAQLAEAKANYNRTVPLARINAVSQSSLDQATASLLSAEESVKAQKAALTNARLELGYTKLHAPDHGVATSTIPGLGDYVGVGTQFPILNKIVKSDTIAVMLSLPMSTYLSVVRPDSTGRPSYENSDLLSDITMILSDGTEFPHKGVYDYTETSVNDQTDALVMKIRFANPNFTIKPGQFVRVKAVIGKPVRAVLIPQQCVSEIQNIASVFVVDSADVVKYREITYSKPFNNDYIVTSGLAPGERVLLNGQFKVKEGMKIQPIMVPTK